MYERIAAAVRKGLKCAISRRLFPFAVLHELMPEIQARQRLQSVGRQSRLQLGVEAKFGDFSKKQRPQFNSRRPPGEAIATCLDAQCRTPSHDNMHSVVIDKRL